MLWSDEVKAQYWLKKISKLTQIYPAPQNFQARAHRSACTFESLFLRKDRASCERSVSFQHIDVRL